jgi:YD repeat-containing protein
MENDICREILDSNNNIIRRVYEDGFTEDYEYDSFGRVVCLKDSYGNVFKTKLITNDAHIITHTMKDGEWIESTFDEQGLLVFELYSNGYWRRIMYCNFEKVYEADSKGEWERIEYDGDGNRLLEEKHNGFWRKFEYENGNCKSICDSDGNKTIWNSVDGVLIDIDAWYENGVYCKYDANWNILYHQGNDGYWRKYGYDVEGNRIYYEDSDGNIMAPAH